MRFLRALRPSSPSRLVLLALAVLLAFVLTLAREWRRAPGTAAPLPPFNADTQAAALLATEPTAPDLKVAFIGDTGQGPEFAAVLQLIKREGADLVLHGGDFDYGYDADGFFATIDAILGPDLPYLAAVGNHDLASWAAGCRDPDGCYAQFVTERMARTGLVPEDADLNDQMYTVNYRGLKLVLVGAEPRSGAMIYAPYIRRQLAAAPEIWKICGWHKNQHAMQLGSKGDEMGWEVYETCRQYGAIIATGHEHSYERTKTLTSMQHQLVDPSQHPSVDGVPGNPDQLAVGPGRSFVFVSGLGGRGMRDQERCTPHTYPYGGGPGCNYIWASAFTSDQTGGVDTYGALFITFGVDGDPARARGYFKTTAGEVVDEFTITAASAARTPAPRAPAEQPGSDLVDPY